ncbi:hypothetical protein HYU17_04715 [Candidatus Woesearchaeota archaeon]|nr:hypothetical protein [Candidatus Woesearchaeota archaeon]
MGIGTKLKIGVVVALVGLAALVDNTQVSLPPSHITASGFPSYIQDARGLALQPCLGVNPDGSGKADKFCILSDGVNYDLTAPISFPDNFPAEFFYWTADSYLAFSEGGSALMVLALEGAFAGEEAVAGEQSVFARVRFRLDVPETGTYTVAFPFGTRTYVVDALEPGPEIRDTSDIGCFALGTGVLSCDPNVPLGNTNNFGLARLGLLGPFLRAVSPAPPAGYLGNPAVLQTVTGGTNGNTFRVQGPSAASTAETNMFAVSGKIATRHHPYK